MTATESLAGQLKTSPEFTHGGKRHELDFEPMSFAWNRYDSES